MAKILMVCLGNICRSPLAEGILKAKINERGLPHIVDSAGTSSYHIGEPPDERMIQTALKHGVDISIQRSRQFRVEDFDYFDNIYVMDSSNYKNVTRQCRNNRDREKVDHLLNAINPDMNQPVPDPWYGGEEGFETVYSLVEEACENIVQTL
jgi:protein-tyrosine phosphatase